jgi:hypothetical protein
MPKHNKKLAVVPQARLSIRDLLDRAKASIEAGESHMHQAANDVAAAYKLGATQTEIAEAVGKSQAWVCGLLKWRDSGWADTPFGPQVKAAREARAIISQTNNRVDQLMAKAKAAIQRGDAATRDAEAHYSKAEKLALIRHQKAMELSGPEMEQQYTALIQDRQLYEGACELPWSRYFAYRDQHPECTPLTSEDLAYVGQWTSAAASAPAVVATTTAAPSIADETADPSLASAPSIDKAPAKARPQDDLTTKIQRLKALTLEVWPFYPPYDADNEDPDEDNSPAAYNEELDKLVAELTEIQTLVNDSLLLLQQRRVPDIASDKKAESPVEVVPEDSAAAIAAAASKAKAWLTDEVEEPQ